MGVLLDANVQATAVPPRFPSRLRCLCQGISLATSNDESRSATMKDKPPTAPASEGNAQRGSAGKRSGETPTTDTRRSNPRKREPSPDAEGGQPVDEMDLDGDGARRV